MATKSGELREILLESIEDVRTGKIDASQASSIAKLAKEVSSSIAVEIAAHDAEMAEGKLGDMPLGETS